jgi:hypothetical protein
MSMETKKPPKDAHGAEEQRYEKRDANLPALLQFGFWLAIVIVVAVVGMKYTLNYFQRVQPAGPPASPLSNARVLPPGPRLQAHPHQELHDYCTGQQLDLTSYRWVDQQNGIVQIPVDRAMELVLERGLPVRAANQAPAGSAEMHQMGTVDSPLPAGVEGPCGYLTELDKKEKPGEEPKE